MNPTRLSRRLSVLRLAAFAAAAACVLGSALYVAALPDVASLQSKNPATSAFIERARASAKRAKKPWTLRRQWVPLSQVSPHLVRAVVLSEDAAFWRHEGIDFDELKVAMQRNLEERRMAYGASTITQQLAKNLYLSPSRNPLRKVKEYFIARRLEEALTKRRILELYLNFAEWGPGVYGAEAAARRHFGKPASDLTPEEAVALATALPNPRQYSPTKDGRYLSRQRRVLLARMRRAGYLPAATDAPASVAR